MRGSSRRARPGGCSRFGPAKGRGEARSEKIGSVSRFRPPSWASTVAWPTQVTAGGCAGPALPWMKPRSAGWAGMGTSGRGGSPRRAALQRQRITSASDLASKSPWLFWKPPRR